MTKFMTAPENIAALIADLRYDFARLIALHGLGSTGDDRMAPSSTWTKDEWERRILETIPSKAAERCYALADALLEALERSQGGREAQLRAALAKCRSQFEFYVTSHMAKQPPDMDKAATNQEFVELVDEALALRPQPSTATGEEGTRCEGCGQPVRVGQIVHLYDDVGEVHLDCTKPYALSDDPKAMILAGSPMRLFPASLLAKEPPHAD
jgi:hypothetical protein